MKRFADDLRVVLSVVCLALLAAPAQSQTINYYPNQGWGPDNHDYTVAYRDNGFDGGAFEPDGGNTVTVCTQLSIRAKESGAGSSTIDIVLYRWSGTDWEEHVKTRVTIDGGTFAWRHSEVLADTLPDGFYRLGCCNEAGNPVTIQCTNDESAESAAYVKPSLSSCPNPWGVSSENICHDDLNIYMTYTQKTVEDGVPGRRNRIMREEES